MQREAESARDLPAPHQFRVTQRPLILQGTMAGSIPKTGCVDATGNKQLGKAPGKGQAVWDGAVGRAVGLHPLPQGQTVEEASSRTPWGRGKASHPRADNSFGNDR